jgi:Uncharacterised nucleotidyltransferase
MSSPRASPDGHDSRESLKTAAHERDLLKALLAALDDPAHAAELPGDDPMLVTVARHHRLTPLLSITCAALLPAPLADLFRRDRLATVARNMVLRRAGEECIRALGEAGIPAIVLKGLDYEARLYDKPGARPTADVDLLVPNEARRAAFGILDRLGFEPRAWAPGFDEPDYHEVAWTRGDVEVDLHLALVPFVRCRIDYSAIWADARPFRFGSSDALVLSAQHAAIFQSLHMGVDHFAVPAIYLLDLTRLLPDSTAVRSAEATAKAWLCHAPFVTAVGLAAAFLPRWQPAPDAPSLPLRSRRVVDAYGSTSPLPRPEQLLRKFSHFDTFGGALHYLVVQSRRNLRERVARGLGKRSARERLSL